MELSPEVVRAEQADAAGRHTEAINQLVAGTRRNDVEATTRLGKRLLLGDRAPHLPKDAAGLLKEAAEAGGAEAAAITATLCVLGISTGQNVEAALEYLALAAERGSTSAQRQLLVLAGRSPDASLGPGESWRRIAQTADLGFWRTAPRGVDLHADPLVRSFEKFLPPLVCGWLVHRSRGRLTRALVYEALQKKTTVHPTRTNTAANFNLLETDVVCSLVQVRMCACLGVALRQLEPLTVLHYAPGEEITDHFDFVDPNVPDYEREIAHDGQRIVTFLVYLNDDYGGGETAFPRLGISHKGRVTEGLFFTNALRDGSADMRTLHAGRPPLDGEKWIVSQFVRNRPVF